MAHHERPLLVLLLPQRLEQMPQRAAIEQLLAAPGVVAVDPPRVRLGPSMAAAVAPRQAKRMKLPGVPYALAVFDDAQIPLAGALICVPYALAVFDDAQIPLAGALITRHPAAELWSLAGPDPQADFIFDLAAATDLAPAWERMEGLGIESGRLGSERLR